MHSHWPLFESIRHRLTRIRDWGSWRGQAFRRTIKFGFRWWIEKRTGHLHRGFVKHSQKVHTPSKKAGVLHLSTCGTRKSLISLNLTSNPLLPVAPTCSSMAKYRFQWQSEYLLTKKHLQHPHFRLGAPYSSPVGAYNRASASAHHLPTDVSPLLCI